MIKQSYGDGSYVSFTYDDKKQLRKKEAYRSAGHPEAVTTYEYDRKGNLLCMIDSKVSETGAAVPYLYTCYSYDKYSRVIAYGEFIQETVPTEEEKNASMIRYEYDAEDNLQQVIYPSGIGCSVESLIYHYNDMRTRLQSIGMVVSGQERCLREYSYDSLGQVTKMRTYTDASGAAAYTDLCYTYDNFGRIQKMSYKDVDGVEKESHTYAYDKNHNILSELEKNVYAKDVAQQLNRNRDYTYDAFGQLVKSVETNYNDSNKTSVIRYTYDKAGNRLKKEESGAVTSYTYNGVNQLVSSNTVKGDKTTAEVTYLYDAKGNQTAENDSVGETSKESSYSVAGYLTGQTIKRDGSTVLIQENLYNGDGERISRTENGDTTKYIHDDAGLLYTLNGQNELQSFNLYGESGAVISTVRKEDGKDNFYFYNKDIKGSTTSLLDDADSSAGIYSYSDFGETSEIQEATITNEICYTGAVYDENTGLYYLSARYYNPATGRFISQDTYRGESAAPESWQMYAYCVNNPIAYVDPSGHFVETIVDIASIGVSTYELVTDPSWINLGYLAWDVGAVIVPFAPGSYTVKSVKTVTKTVKRGKRLKKLTKTKKLKYIRYASKASEFRNASKLTIGPYTQLRAFVKLSHPKETIEAHHILEQRIITSETMKGLNKNRALSVPMTQALHRRVTADLRKKIPYGTDYTKLKKSKVQEAIRYAYRDMPALRKYALKYLNSVWTRKEH